MANCLVYNVLSSGRHSRRQTVLLPGVIPVSVNCGAATIVQDVVERICVMLNILDPIMMEEFALFYLWVRRAFYQDLIFRCDYASL